MSEFVLGQGGRCGAVMPSPSALRDLQTLLAGADDLKHSEATLRAFDQIAAQSEAAKRGELSA